MKKILILACIIGFTNISFTQFNWRKGGNGIAGSVQPTIGTNGSWNAPFQLMTVGQIRMHINQSGTNYLGIPTPGYIGIGNNPTDERSRLTITGTNNSSFNGDGYRYFGVCIYLLATTLNNN